ncbi:hypothetical protein ACFRAM_09525 [Paenibacillus sp. NPDC056722]
MVMAINAVFEGGGGVLQELAAALKCRLIEKGIPQVKRGDAFLH